MSREENMTKTICRLNKSLHGFKQASGQWNVKFTEALLSFKFLQSKYNHSLFIKGSTEGVTVTD